MIDLSRREILPEIMDQPGLDAEAHARALRGLARINRVSATSRILWKPIRQHAEAHGAIRVLDVACGGGDVLLRLAHWTAQANLAISFAGCDISETAMAYARNVARISRQNVQFFQHDILAEPLSQTYDVVTCNLFLHHLDENAALCLLTRLREAASRLVLVHDLLRSPAGYGVAYMGTRLLSRSSIVHYDGPLSVRAALTIPEAREIAARSGMPDARVSWQWPFRFLLEWRRS